MSGGSLLDRLLERASDGRGRPLRDLQAAIRRDLQALLNARRPWASTPDSHAALRNSILGYGLPDFAAGAFNSPAAREALCKEIASTIRRFEPRLSNVVVKLRDRAETMDPLLRIRIEGVLRMEGEDAGDAEVVSFDTVLDATTTDMAVGSQTDV
jgi:type VI secretion system protein ImpF